MSAGNGEQGAAAEAACDAARDARAPPPVADGDASVQPAGTVLKKYAFTEESKHTLLQCDRQVDANLDGNGDKEESFKKVLDLFVTSVPQACWTRFQKPAIKTLRDEFRS